METQIKFISYIMKRVFFSLAVVTVTLLGANAQEELVNKRGQPILPKAGDFGLSVDATPMLRYVGGFFSNSGASTSNLFQQVGIKGQYFLTDNTSVRATLNLDIGSSTNNTFVPKIDANGVSHATDRVENSEKKSGSDIQLYVGYVYHRGNGRLRAFYGPEAGLRFGSGKETYEWGNPLNANYTTSRTLERKSAVDFGFSLGGFVGVEYYVAPRISLAGEFGLHLGFNTKGKGKVITEYWDNGAKTRETKTAGSSSFYFRNSSVGNISANFYF